MSAAAPSASYSLHQVQQMLGLSRTVVGSLIQAGFVTPDRGPRNALRFSFRDLMLLRTAHALQRGGIPPRKVLRALERLRAELPESLPLTGLRISAIGPDVVVRDRTGPRSADSGQLLMDFEVAAAGGGSVSFLAPGAGMPAEAGDEADGWFARGEAAEPRDAVAAEAAYREALARSPQHARAAVNLGAMLCEAGQCAEAARVCAEAIASGAVDPLLHFNHAIALDDLGRRDEALASYRRALDLQPGLADAHYNIGCLLEQRGDARGALRHFNAYRRLQAESGG